MAYISTTQWQLIDGVYYLVRRLMFVTTFVQTTFGQNRIAFIRQYFFVVRTGSFSYQC